MNTSWVRRLVMIVLIGIAGMGVRFALAQDIRTSSLPHDISDALVGHGHALLIGVSHYDRGGWPELESITGDLNALKLELTPHFKVVEILRNPNISQLREKLRTFFEGTGYDPNERLFIYYAGHGFTDLNTLTGEAVGYITASDTPNNGSNPADAAAGAISMNEIDTLSRLARARQILAVFDSCFSGTIFTTRGGNEKPPVPLNINTAREALRWPVRSYISAGDENDRIPANSQFARQLLKGISGGADFGKDHFVTGTELGLYLHNTMPAIDGGTAIPRFGKVNSPVLSRGEFIFLAGLPSLSLPTPLPPGPSPVPPIPVLPPPPKSVSASRATWRQTNMLGVRAGTWNVIVASPGTDLGVAQARLKEWCSRFPGVAFQLFPTVHPGGGNDQYAIDVGFGLTKPAADKLAQQVQALGMTGAYPSFQAVDADGPDVARWSWSCTSDFGQIP